MSIQKAAEPVVIENPVINSPFAEPRRHYRFDDGGITDDIVCERRPSSYFIPIARPRKKSKDAQQTFEDWTADRIEENKNVNRIRQRVKLWREGRYPDVTRTTARLLEHWNSADRHRRLFFCQVEALETLNWRPPVPLTPTTQAALALPASGESMRRFGPETVTVPV